jgi:hypothetical protein
MLIQLRARHAAIVAILVPACIGGACGRSGAKTPVSPASPTPAPTPAAQSSVKITGTVLDESGAAIGGATVSLSNSGVGSTDSHAAVTDNNGRYEITLTGVVGYGGHADKTGYETTWRDSEFAAAPNVLNFRLFRTVHITDADSAHVTVTTDGSVCGIDDDWWCRVVRVTATRPGTLTVQTISDDPSIHAIAVIGTIGLCCPGPSQAAVSAGDELLVYVHLPWNGPGTGVAIHTSIH